ncbi:MAG: tripartite tricarboxylate transporter substrate binding protein [Clostridia bacterium]|nr:tripartite tricarboxylate transporter substrate binding protein [Clostridia bacterium]
MKRRFRTILTLVLAISLMTGLAVPMGALADDSWPSKSITLIIPYSAGGTADTFGRLVAEYLGKEIGATITCVNQAGSSGEIGALAIAGSDPDGYTLGILNFPDFFISDLTNDDFEFDTLSSVQYITSFTNQSNAYYVRKGNGKVESWDEFINYCKENPGRFTVSESGIAHRFIAASIMDYFGIEYTTINYDGAAESQAAIVGGQVDGASLSNSRLETLWEQGVIPIAYGGSEPCPLDPDVPLFGDYGLSIDFLNVRVTLVAPAGVPQEIIDKLAEGCRKICEDQNFVDTFTSLHNPLDPVFYGDVGDLAAKYYEEAQALCEQYKDQIIGIK